MELEHKVLTALRKGEIELRKCDEFMQATMNAAMLAHKSLASARRLAESNDWPTLLAEHTALTSDFTKKLLRIAKLRNHVEAGLYQFIRTSTSTPNDDEDVSDHDDEMDDVDEDGTNRWDHKSDDEEHERDDEFDFDLSPLSGKSQDLYRVLLALSDLAERGAKYLHKNGVILDNDMRALAAATLLMTYEWVTEDDDE